MLKANSPGESGEQRAERNSSVDGVAADRITLRLRHGDRTLAAERAGACGMKTGSYLAMLIHNHVRGSAVLPPNELDLIKATGAQLAALGRQLRILAERVGGAGSVGAARCDRAGPGVGWSAARRRSVHCV